MARSWKINGRFPGQPLTGVQRYAREIVAGLDRLIQQRHPLADDLATEILVPAHIAVAEVTALFPNIPVRQVGRGAGHLWEQTTLAAEARGAGLICLCNTAPLLHNRLLLCLHDPNTRAYPQSYSAPYKAYQRLVTPLLARRALRLVTVSHYSASQIAAWGLASEDAVTVIPNGHEHALRWTPRHSETTRKAASADTIVVIGSPAPHKNVAMLLGLAPRLEALGFRIALVGARDARVFRDGLRGAAANNVVMLGRLTDNQMAALTSSSLCLAFPSLAEGFGLPPLEAMATGCPVVASDQSSLPEICGDAVLYAPPDQPDAWLEAFRALRADPSLRFKLAAAGKARAPLFSWAQSALAWLELMADADGLSEPSALLQRQEPYEHSLRGALI